MDDLGGYHLGRRATCWHPEVLLGISPMAPVVAKSSCFTEVVFVGNDFMWEMADKTQQSQQMTSRASEIFRVWAFDDVVKCGKNLRKRSGWLDDSTGTIWSFGWGFIEVLIWFYSFFLVTKNLVRQIGLSHCDLPIVSWYHSLSSRVHFSDMPGNATVFSPMESKTVTVDICFHTVLMRHFNIPEPRLQDPEILVD